jgi:hypothetical protein
VTQRKNRFLTGFGWGVAATVAMSLLTLIGTGTGASPIPKPIPAAIVGRLGGAALPGPAVVALAAVAHLAYGGFWGGVLAIGVDRVTWKAGLALGVGLWLLMQVAVLPFVGWGLFGASVTPAIAGATLLLHLVYGGVLGALVDREAAPSRGPGRGVKHA